MDIQALAQSVDFDKPLFRARSSEVFAISDKLVLKLYFDDIDEENTDIEVLNTTTAFENGCTPMECYGKVCVNGRNGIVLKRLSGISLTSMPEKNPAILFKAGKILAELHRNVHATSAPALRDVREVAASALATPVFDFLSSEQREKIATYLRALPAADNLIHMDFHTDNIMCDGENYQVIDWMTAAKGSPYAELAMMEFLFHNAELFPGSSALKIFFYQTVRSFIYKGFIKNYVALTGVDVNLIPKWSILAWVIRAGFWDIESEREYLQGQILSFVKSL